MTRVEDLMTRNPSCCAPDAGLQQVARLMVESDCGVIPVVDSGGQLVGVITDRDIVCRLIAKGANPMTARASDCMSSPVVSITPDTTLEECCRLMEEHQVRRVPVVELGRCCGIVSQADIARHAPEQKTAEVVRDVSQPALTSA